MKSFKKALAVLLSVLMVVFSFPFTAMAIENPYQTEDEIYATDYDVVVHAFVMEYDTNLGYGFFSDAYADTGEAFIDPTNMNINDLSSPDGLFCIYITVENLDGCEGSQLTFNYDSSKITPAAYGRRDAVSTGSSAKDPLETAEIYDGADCTGTTAILNGADVAYTVYCPKGQFTPANETVIDDTIDGAVLPGAVIACFGFQMLEDSFDLTEVFQLDLHGNFSFFESQGYSGNTKKYIVPYNGLDYVDGVNDIPSHNTMFTFPEWGLAPAEDVNTDVTYTYTFANGTSTDVTVAEGETPTAPANTATATVSNNDGTHTTTTYTWPAFDAATTSYTEVTTSETVDCTKVVDAEAVAPGHTTDGSTEAWHCSECGYTVTASPVDATGHSWDAGVVTAPTCTEQGYTTYTCTDNDGGKLVTDYTAIDPDNHTAIVDDAAVAATCKATGLTAGQHCEACGAVIVAQTVTQIDPDNHTNIVTDAAVAATCTTSGLTEGSHCEGCGAIIVAQQTIDALDHDWSAVSSTNATCVTAGTVSYECTRCDATKTETGVLDPTNHEGPIVQDPEVPATCISTGLTEGSHCDACGAAEVEQQEIPIDPNNHLGDRITDAAVPATCTTPGLTEGSHCEDCGAVLVPQQTIDALGHDWDDGVVTKEATRAEDGEITYTCGNDASHTYTDVIPALGVQISVTGNDLGTTTLNGVASDNETIGVPYAKTYTLVATPAENAEFIGWMVNGKLVSESASYTTGAYADLTYVPVFAEKDATFTITFIDQFNRVIATLTNAEVAALSALPTAPEYPHYTFDAYNMTLDEVKALDAADVVIANYTKDDSTFVVNAAGCTITVDGVDYADTATVAHDALVTVKPANDDVATAWTVNGSEASYAAEYSFYVTADVDVTYATSVVVAAPTVANVSMDAVEGSAYKVRFLATRSVTEGYTLLESGFIYGKNLAEADLILDNVNGSTCRIAKNSNMAADGQFAITFGVTAATGTACARAYIIVKDAAGTVSAIYAPMQEWVY